MFDQVVKQFPDETPTLTYIPDADTLVVVHVVGCDWPEAIRLAVPTNWRR